MNTTMEKTIADCKISSVHTKQNLYPLIASFQNGKLQSTGEVNISGGIYIDSSSRNNKNVIIALNNMLYTGPENVSESRNLIAIRNRTTGDVRLVEVGNVLLRALPPVEAAEKEKKTEEKEAQKTTQAELSAAFGSKRSKRAQEQSKKLKIDADTMIDQLEKTISEKVVKDEDITDHHVDINAVMENYAPPINRNATDVSKVYTIESILTEEQLTAFRKVADHVLESAECQIEITEYISNKINALKESERDDKQTVCCLLIYVDCLIGYLLEQYKKVTSLNYKVCTYSQIINALVLDNFSMVNEKSRTRPQSLKDKAICYIIVLLLLSNNYIITDISDLAKFIKVPMTKMSQMVKVVGAHALKESVVLKLPLAPPPVINHRRSRH